jgi:hypothetical protein
MDLKNGTKNRGQRSTPDPPQIGLKSTNIGARSHPGARVAKDFLKEVFDNIGLISYTSSIFVGFLQFHTVPQISRMRAQRAPVPQ